MADRGASVVCLAVSRARGEGILYMGEEAVDVVVLVMGMAWFEEELMKGG
jgi:hypothetical protein